MATFAILGASFLGACAGILGWLLFGLGIGAAFAVYLAFSLSLPTVLIVVAALRQGAAPQHGLRPATDTDVLAA